MSSELRQALEQVARRFRRVRLWGGLAACWLALAVLGCAIAAWGPVPGLARRPAGLAAGAPRAPGRDDGRGLRPGGDPLGPRPALGRPADRGEAPRPRHRLLAAVEEVEAAPGGRLGFLQATVVREALDHRRAHDWDETVPTWLLRSVKVGPRRLPCCSWSRRSPPRLPGQLHRLRRLAPRAGRPTPRRSRSTPAMSSSSAAARSWSSPASTARRRPTPPSCSRATSREQPAAP